MEIKRTGTGPCRIVLVPGGPGLVTDFYRELIALLAEKNEVVTYEQRGSYTRGLDDYPQTIAEYVDELHEVLSAVNATTKPTVILGQSFGGAVTIESLAGGMRVDGAILSNAFASGAILKRGIEFRKSRLPAEFRTRYASTSPTDAEAINQLLAEYWFPNHFCRIDPWPESLTDALSKLNPALMALFIGTNLFEADGSLANWSRENVFGTISVPVLTVSGQHDYYRSEDVREMASRFPKGEVWVSDRASHTPWLEDTENFKTVVQGFVDRLMG